ncbi:hypothetical protein EZV62_004860 [Acer yangbiense]|uniref:Uncharacterized protein n=1 Tax=Acer yangbiense TaxID=1000413 RepID=A0A5C7IL61_9ROSI|nr:hypothetical protein EZV62_004860 [Acer yangbiense]
MSSSSSTMGTRHLQSSGMLSRQQLLYLFNRFSFLTSQPDVKKRVADAVNEKKGPVELRTMSLLLLKQVFGLVILSYMQEAVAVTTDLQEEIFLEMGVGIKSRYALAGYLRS